MPKPTHPFLPYSRQCIEDDDIAAVVSVMKSDYLTTGPQIAIFENAVKSYLDVSYATLVSSGTAALHLAMLSVDIGPGDCVVVPAITFVATANAVRLCGAEVLFADVDPLTGLMETQHLKQVLEANANKNIKAVVPVHLTGQTADLAALTTIARQHQLIVIEDACQAFGAEHRLSDTTVKVGACHYADLTVFSFHPVKTICMGEGGLVTTKDPEIAHRLTRLRNHGITRLPEDFIDSDESQDEQGQPNPWYYEMQALGFNYRASDLNAILGLSQLKKADQFIQKRQEILQYYHSVLEIKAPQIQPIVQTTHSNSAYHLNVCLIDFTNQVCQRGQLMRRLKEKQIGTQVHYIPVPEQPYYRKQAEAFPYPGAKAYYAKALTLPLFPQMTPSNVDYVIQSLVEILENP